MQRKTNAYGYHIFYKRGLFVFSSLIHFWISVMSTLLTHQHHWSTPILYSILRQTWNHWIPWVPWRTIWSSCIFSMPFWGSSITPVAYWWTDCFLPVRFDNYHMVTAQVRPNLSIRCVFFFSWVDDDRGHLEFLHCLIPGGGARMAKAERRDCWQGIKICQTGCGSRRYIRLPVV